MFQLLRETTEALEAARREVHYYRTQHDIVSVKRMFLEDTNARLEAERGKLIEEVMKLKNQVEDLKMRSTPAAAEKK